MSTETHSFATIFIINAVAIAAIHVVLAWISTHIPIHWVATDRWLFRTRSWENEGELWHRLFGVRAWKQLLPDGAQLFSRAFKKKKLLNRNPDYLERFAVETCRGELAHWAMLLISPIFFIWNPPLVGAIAVAYFIIGNVPCIVVQRYNRPAMLRLARAG